MLANTFLSVLLLALALALVAANEVCDCSPTSYEVTLDFSLTCASPGSLTTSNSGLNGISCVAYVAEDAGLTGEALVPVRVTNVDINVRARRPGVLLVPAAPEAVTANFLNGASFQFAPPTIVSELGLAPLGFEMRARGINSNGQVVMLMVELNYNPCAYPVISVGQFVGWFNFTGLGGINQDACEAITAPTLSPTVSASPSAPPSVAPSQSAAPSLLPSATPSSVPSSAPTRRPTVSPQPRTTPCCQNGVVWGDFIERRRCPLGGECGSASCAQSSCCKVCRSTFGQRKLQEVDPQSDDDLDGYGEMCPHYEDQCAAQEGKLAGVHMHQQQQQESYLKGGNESICSSDCVSLKDVPEMVHNGWTCGSCADATPMR